MFAQSRKAAKMFSIFKKKAPHKNDLSELGVDMHSHLLPGIDDGAADTEISANLIHGLTDLGYRKLITTPHIMWDLYRNSPETIADSLKILQQADRSSTEILHTAAEYFLDDHFDQMLENDVPFLTLKNNWVLVEFSFVTSPLNFKQILFNMQVKGYQPVLAHPERYLYFSGDRHYYDELKDTGCLFQLNLLSLTGYYGKGPQELAQFLIKKKYVDLLGTDLHHSRHLNALQTAPHLSAQVKSLLDTGTILNPTL